MMNRSFSVSGAFFAMWVLIGGAISAIGANICVGPTATGNGNGSDWANQAAWSSVSFVRGNTYYLADGNYSSKTLSTAASGSTLITIKKAIESDHGPTGGWNSAYGDGQAVIANSLSISTSNWLIDGQVRDEADWWNESAYGIAVIRTTDGSAVTIANFNPAAVNNVTLRCVYILLPYGAGQRYAISTENYGGSSPNGTGHVFTRMLCRGGNQHWFVRNSHAPIIEYSASEKTGGNATWHGENINLYYNPHNTIIRFNKFRDSFTTYGNGGTAIIAIQHTDGHEIYGNTFYKCYASDGTLGFIGNNGRNIKVYNNTFAGGTGNNNITLNTSALNGNIAQNNLWVACSSSQAQAGTADNNTSTSDTGIFVNYSAGDLRLAVPTAAGAALNSPYNLDMLGKTRGADGTFDRGAYEFGALSVTPLNAVSPSSLDFGSVTTNTTLQLNFTVRNAGSGTLTGSATVTAPFSIVSGGSYSLGAGQSQTVTVRFNPLVVGSYSRTVTFTGGGGASATVNGVAIVQVIADTTPPTVALGAPAAGATVSELVTFSATASDNIGVAGVRFFVGGSEVFDDLSAPYAFVWDSRWASNSSYQVYAQARDAAGNSKWSATNVITVANSPTALPAPVAYWNFSEGSGTTANDGQSNNLLTLRNGAAMSAPGKFGAGLLLDGVNDRADAPNSPSLDVAGNAITVAAWVKLENQNAWQQILAKISAVGNLTAPFYSWHLFGGHVSSTQWRPQFQLTTTGQIEMGVNVSSAVNVNYGEWVHIAGVYDGTAVRIYINGVGQGSAVQSGNILGFNQPLYIGAHGLPGEFAKGVIDEVRIYSRAMSPTQVQTLYGFTDGIVIPAPPSELRIVGTE
jgi:hypothetical protein